MKAKIIIFILTIVFSLDAYAYGGANASSELSATNNAGMAQLSGTLGAVASVVEASKQFKQCAGTPPNYSACVLGALNLAQAALLNKGAKNANAAATQLGGEEYRLPEFLTKDLSGFCSTGQSCTPTDLDRMLNDFETAFKTGNPNEYKKAMAKLDDKMKSLANDFAKNGVSVDLENGIATDQNGKTVALGAEGVGLSNALTGELQSKLDALKSIADKALVEDRKIASSGGGGGASIKGASSGGGLGDMGSLNSNLNKKNNFEDRKKKFLAGLSNSDKAKDGFGVEGDNLFEMLQRRYTKKVKNQEFIPGRK